MDQNYVTLATQLLKNIAQNSPLILCVTNIVTVNDVANALIAIKASPAMGSDAQDSHELRKIAQGIALNLGGLNQEHKANLERLVSELPLVDEVTFDPYAFDLSQVTLTSMHIKKHATQIRTDYPYHTQPTVLDLVAYGATPTRIRVGDGLLQHHLTAIKGNYSEINALIDKAKFVKGVDATADLDNPEKLVLEVARKYKTLVMMTGPIDYLTDGTNVFKVAGGSVWASRMTGTGCIVMGLLTAFLTGAPTVGALLACSVFAKVTAYQAQKRMEASQTIIGPYSFRRRWFDEMWYQADQIVNQDSLLPESNVTVKQVFIS